MPKVIKNKVLETKLVNWRKLDWFQGNLKELSKVNYEKLKKSLIEKNFISPFYVWKNQILDGHHRKKAMEMLEQEGYTIPEKLPAVHLDLKDKKEAAGVLLAINSQFAKITEDGLYEFMNDFEIDISDMSDFELGNIDMDKFGAGYFDISQPTEAIDDKTTTCPKCGAEF